MPPLFSSNRFNDFPTGKAEKTVETVQETQEYIS